jgi:putative phosphoesterase
VRVVVVADTHLRRSWPNRQLPRAAVRELATADVILHAGDITQAEHLEALAVHAPVHAVLGNNDPELEGVLPETLELELAGVRVAMLHDSGPARGRERRLHERFPDADVVVSGTATSRGTPRASRGSCCSTPARRPSGGANRTAPSGSSSSTPAGSPTRGSSWWTTPTNPTAANAPRQASTWTSQSEPV